MTDTAQDDTERGSMTVESGSAQHGSTGGSRGPMEAIWHRRLVPVVIGGAVVSACVGLPGFPPEAGDTTNTNTTMDDVPSTSTSSPLDGTSSTGSSAGTSTTSVGSDETETAATSSTTGPEPAGPFVFEEASVDLYQQVDRKGFPLVNGTLNLLGDKDQYNRASPEEDVTLTFAMNIFQSLETWHLGAPGAQTPDNTGLDDDLISLGLEPCVTPPLPMDSCDNQVGSFAIPDVLTIDLDEPAEFPNGRRVQDPVVDVILAIFLLDLGTHLVNTFMDLDGDGELGPALNPLANDVEFPSE